MLGHNHAISNISSLLLISDTVIYLKKYYHGVLQEYVNKAGDSVYNFALNFCVSDKPVILKIAWLSVCFGLFILGSLFPDTDSKKSIIGRYIHIPVRHRTWTHSIWVVLILGVISIVVRPMFWFTLGYFLHLFWDSLSKGGICWFYPISNYIKYDSGAQIKKKHIFRLYKTGNVSEYVLVSVITAVAVGLTSYIVVKVFVM